MYGLGRHPRCHRARDPGRPLAHVGDTAGACSSWTPSPPAGAPTPSAGASAPGRRCVRRERVREAGHGRATGRAAGSQRGEERRVLAGRAAYAGSEEAVRVPTGVPDAWTPAFLAQLIVPEAQLVHVRRRSASNGGTCSPRAASPSPSSSRAPRPQPAGPCVRADPSVSGARSRRSCPPGATREVRASTPHGCGSRRRAHHYPVHGASAPPLRWVHAPR